MILYHSTSTLNLDAIKRDGLIPQAGSSCQDTSNENNVGVYLWRHKEKAMGWAAGHWGEHGIVLEVGVHSRDTRLVEDEEFFEEESEAYVYHGRIPTVAILAVTPAVESVIEMSGSHIK
jgi:hypothetical protein